MNDEETLEQLRAIKDQMAYIRSETSNPAVNMALRHAVYYTYLAASFFGDVGISPEVDEALESSQLDLQSSTEQNAF